MAGDGGGGSSLEVKKNYRPRVVNFFPGPLGTKVSYTRKIQITRERGPEMTLNAKNYNITESILCHWDLEYGDFHFPEW